MAKYHFFWQSQSPFSNWYNKPFIYKGKTFVCSEQAMMYEKALLFKDAEIAAEILLSKNPKDQKALGRKIRNFNDKIWNTKKYSIVKEILTAKFSDPVLKKILLKYKGYELVEASPYDRIWGIGYEEKDALDNIDNWGKNLLGVILTELSNEL
jgi:hypothetical protein